MNQHATTISGPATRAGSRSAPRRLASALAVAASLGFGLVAAPMASRAGSLEDLQAFATHTQSARGSFTQRVVSRVQKASKPTRGDFVFARPGRFRWTYREPYEQVLIADGEKLSIYDKDLNQVTVRKLGDALGSTPAAILFGSNDIARSFDLRDTGVRGGVAWIEATPKSRDTTFEKISIGFRNGELAAMELRDALGQITMLEFTGVERNAKVDASTFAFVPPQGADVLQN